MLDDERRDLQRGDTSRVLPAAVRTQLDVFERGCVEQAEQCVVRLSGDGKVFDIDTATAG